MSIKYYSNKVQETFTATPTGSGNVVLDGPPLGYRSFVTAFGSGNRFNYYIYRLDTNFEWEVGVGYITVSGGLNILTREKVLSSTNNNNHVSFTRGTKYIDAIIGSDRVNSSFFNLEEKTASFSPPSASATYVIDSLSSGVTVSLPQVTSASDPVTMSFLLNATSGNQYQQANAILLVPNGSQTINGSGSYEISIIKDYLQIASVPSQSGWVVLDPIMDSTYPYGNEGTVQFKSNNAFSGVSQLVWDSSNSSLLVGGTGVASSANIIFPSASGGSSVVFNEQSSDNDFRVEGSGKPYLFFVDGGQNRIGINSSNPIDILTINANGGKGLTIYNTGAAPSVVLSNQSVSGITPNNIVGSIEFSGLNSSNNFVNYGKIYSVIDSRFSSSESSSIHIESISNGSSEDVGVFSTSGITLGFNNQNLDGVLLGQGSSNEGNNVVLGYFHNICGDNCVVAGDNLSLSSGSFGGIIGSNHSASGNNIWILGGSGISVTGNNRTYVSLNGDTYINLNGSGSLEYSTLCDNDVSLIIDNSSILTSGISENLIFKFTNTNGDSKSGLVLSSNITSSASGSENSYLTASIINNGNQLQILNISNNNVTIGYNNTSGNNIVHGYNNTISNSGNAIFGQSIAITGNNNTVFGHSINCSGSNNTIFGKDNSCLSSGNLGIVIFGNNNEVDEDYSISIGIDNANSGLYSVSCGYMNGVHGDYSVGIGESNTVVANGSVAFGRSNNLSNTTLAASLFGLGVGNLGQISNTGIMVGYNNEMYGSGGLLVGSTLVSSGDNSLFGKSSEASGSNNIVFGNNNTLVGNNSMLISNSGSLSGNNLIKIGYDSSNMVFGTGSVTFNTASLNLPNIWYVETIICSGTGYVNDLHSLSGIINIPSGLATNNIVSISGLVNFPSGINVGGSGVIANTGNFTHIDTNTLDINTLNSPSGSVSVNKLLIQDNRVKSESLAANSGGASGTVTLSMNSAEYQFFNSLASSITCVLPDGSGYYSGKKFTVVNLDATYNIVVNDSNAVTLDTITTQSNCSFVHAGNNAWIRITSVISN